MKGHIRVESRQGFELHTGNIWELVISHPRPKRIIMGCTPPLIEYVRVFVDNTEIAMPEEMRPISLNQSHEM